MFEQFHFDQLEPHTLSIITKSGILPIQLSSGIIKCCNSTAVFSNFIETLDCFSFLLSSIVIENNINNNTLLHYKNQILILVMNS